jgi:hypothetical protein
MTHIGSSPPLPHPIRKVKFIPIEDARLLELVGLFGETDWTSIANQMPDRTARQCRERWLYFLTPSIINGPWSADEDALLLQKFAEFGSHWKALTQFFPGRTEINIKNHYAALIRRSTPFPGHPSHNSSADVVARASTPNTDSTEKFDDLLPDLLGLPSDLEAKQETSDSSLYEREWDPEYGFQPVLF